MSLPRRALLPDSSVVRFLIVGIANTLFGLLLIYSVKWFLALGDVIANLIGYTLGLILSFTLNSRWSFRYKGNTLSAFVKFMLVILTAYLCNLLVVIIAIENFKTNSYVSQAIGIVPYTLVGYLGSRFVAFTEGRGFEEVRPLPDDELKRKRT
jgi:putative flippase GtrA